MSDTIKIMLVDDSSVIRKILMKILGDQTKFEIVAQAADGQDAVDQLQNKSLAESLEIIVLDIEMPRMDGLTALPKLKALAKNAKIIMASTLTERNAEISLKAMELGATDYLSKPAITEGESAFDIFSRDLKVKVRILGLTAKRLATKVSPIKSITPSIAKNSAITLIPKSTFKPTALAIGSSTGGPDALKKVISALDPRKLNIPIFITQHMPPHFTTLLANNIDKISNFEAAEAKDGDIVLPNKIYLAPGDFHMEVMREEKANVIRLNQNAQENFCRPAVDPMLRSLSKIYGPSLLTCILTGMGQDGLKGATLAREAGGTVISQNEETSVVWGMPAAVTNSGICSYVEPIDNIANTIMGITS